MRIVDVEWTPRGNWLMIRCQCGDDNLIRHRADRWVVQCPGCGERGHLKELRRIYREHGPGPAFKE